MADDFNIFNRRHKITSVDGFLAGEGQQPRRPNFREVGSAAHTVFKQKPLKSSDVSQERSDILPYPAPRKSEVYGVDPRTGLKYDASKGTLNQQSMLNQNIPQSKPLEPLTPQPYTSRPAVVENGKRTKKNKRRDDKNSNKKRSFLKTLLKTLGILILCAGLYFGGKIVYNLTKVTGNNNPFALLGALRRANLNNENGRVNVLVAGNSADDAGHNGAQLTDSIMLLSIDTKNKTGMMLSIPRDLWVSIPREGHSKINAAYTYGGMETLSSVVEDTLGLPVHYNALVNYSAFKDLVDAVGGISVTIDSSDPRGIYDSSLDWTSRRCCAIAKYPNGTVKLDGRQALNLARARGEGAGSYGFPLADFTRTEHQRMMLMAIREKAMSSSTLSNPVKISNLANAIGENVTTNLKADEISTLYSYVKDVPVDKIDSYNINTLKGEGTTMLANYTTPNGQSALIPAAGVDNFEDIATQLQRIFNATPVTREAAKVVVLNGTETTGLARVHGNRLSRKGMEIIDQANATTQTVTTIIDNSKDKKTNTLAELKKTYTQATIIKDPVLTAQYPNAEFIVVLGQEVIPKTTDN